MASDPAAVRRQPAAPSQASDAAPLEGDTAPGPAFRSRYEVVSVEAAPMPVGGQGAEWCRYVLSCGTSRITGLHRGSIDEVTAFAATCVEDFNRRSAGGKGSAGSAYSSKKAIATRR